MYKIEPYIINEDIWLFFRIIKKGASVDKTKQNEPPKKEI